MELKDWGLSQLGMDIWAKKYQNNGESFEEWLDRVSGGDKDVKQLIADKKFLFGGRILASRGVTDRKVTYSNCYVLPQVEDSIEGIYDTAKHLARTFSYGGGVGIDISNLRPKGSPVNNAAKTTSGAVSFMDTFSQVSSVIGQAGRRGALMISMDCEHPDIEDFIDAKKNTDKLEGCNISVRTNGDFIKNSPLMHKLAVNNWDYAEPGILYWDNINKNNLLSEYIKNDEFEYAGVNPCAEEPLPAGGSCLLGAINLSEFVLSPFTENTAFDIPEFKKAVRIAVRALNDVLDEGLELHPLEIQRKTVSEWRQIGLGIMGFADMLIKMGIAYGSEESLRMIDIIGKHMNEAGLLASSELAEEKGSFDKFDPEWILDSEFMKHINENVAYTVSEKGLRNSQLFTIAPTGTISTMLGVSGGVEPLFDVEYTRTTKSLHGEDRIYKVVTPIIEECLEAKGLGDKGKSLALLKGCKEIQWSKTINPFARVDVQAQWQIYIDASISSTVNLPEKTTVEEVENLYRYAYDTGCKGLTIFRDGCARTAILNSGSAKEEPKEEVAEDKRLDTIMPITRADMGDRLEGATYVRTTACGKLYITINTNDKGELVEVFIDPSKSGGCLANVEVIGRLCSSMLRAGVAVEAVIDSAKGVKCSSCARSKKKVDGLSCGDIVAKAIETEYNYRKTTNTKPQSGIAKPIKVEKITEKVKKNEEKVEKIEEKAKCPECGAKLSFTGGCNICPECGYSRCD